MLLHCITRRFPNNSPSRVIQQLSVKQFHEQVNQHKDGLVILDVREPWEWDICSIDNSVYIPMGAISSRYQELDCNKQIVVLCHHGIRSYHVARFLEAQGVNNLFNLQGGINAWAREIDKNMATY